MVMNMTSAQEHESNDEFLTPVQFRRRIGISTRTLQRWVAQGKVVPSHRLPNGHKRFSVTEAERIISDRQFEQASA